MIFFDPAVREEVRENLRPGVKLVTDQILQKIFWLREQNVEKITGTEN